MKRRPRCGRGGLAHAASRLLSMWLRAPGDTQWSQRFNTEPRSTARAMPSSFPLRDSHSHSLAVFHLVVLQTVLFSFLSFPRLRLPLRLLLSFSFSSGPVFIWGGPTTKLFQDSVWTASPLQGTQRVCVIRAREQRDFYIMASFTDTYFCSLIGQLCFSVCASVRVCVRVCVCFPLVCACCV